MGISTDVMIWKLARENAFAKGSARSSAAGFRRILEDVVRKRLYIKKKVRLGSQPQLGLPTIVLNE
jgi:hypothetical protein